MKERRCLFDTSIGRAVVQEPDGRIFLLEMKDSCTVEGPTHQPRGLTLEMWIDTSESITMDCDEYPYTQLKQDMLWHRQRNRMLLFFCLTINAQSDRESRRRDAYIFEQSFCRASTESQAEIEALLVDSSPLPADASTRDAPFKEGSHGARILAKMVEKYGHRPLSS